MKVQREARTERDREREVARILLEARVVAINPARPFVYASGIISPIYTDLRLLMGNPQQRGRVVELLLDRIRRSCDVDALDVIAGVATAGIPWGAWVAERLGKPMAYVREAAKGHGKGQQVEGGVRAGQRAIVVEDLTSTGASALSSAEALRGVGARVDWCFSIFTYGFPETQETFRRAGILLESLCGIFALLEVATSSGRISGEEEMAVREWLAKGPKLASRVDAAQP
ncbi:MAG: orotate phosphoribosyltransferase [Chloroflexi bacterium]|nr:orotate phosphoribosyltransferase [Chloroflexota bacterium]